MVKWIITAILKALSIDEIKELIIEAAKKIVESTDTTWDDKVLEIIIALLDASQENDKKE